MQGNAFTTTHSWQTGADFAGRRVLDDKTYSYLSRPFRLRPGRVLASSFRNTTIPIFSIKEGNA